jgi:hypothetical protein
MKPAELTAPDQASLVVTEPVTEPVDLPVPKQAPPPLRPVPMPPKAGWFRRKIHRMESRISRLSTKNNFWHRVCSWVFLPLAYRSGIRFKHVARDSFSVVLPFRRFNKNWYSAMAGASLLANSEVAGGMFVFGKCGGDYTVVCKHLDYKFLRPCYGPAIYNIEPKEDIEPMVKDGGEFNITLDMSVVQAVHKKDKAEPRVGRATITFHVTPKTQARARWHRRLQRLAGKAGKK